jgi:hypothetical protein
LLVHNAALEIWTSPWNSVYISSVTKIAPATASEQSASATIVVVFDGAKRPNPINVMVYLRKVE